MSDKAFQKAFANTLKHEGTFVNDPDDPGGMTYMGISRVSYPGWPGWAVVDFMLLEDKPFSLNTSLTEMVRSFYFNEFWVRLHCAFVSDLCPDVAAELFDTAVHLSHARAIKNFQEALNLLNRNQKAYRDIPVDGLMGTETRNALFQYTTQFDTQTLVKLMNHLQAGYYISRLQVSPQKEKYVGWFART